MRLMLYNMRYGTGSGFKFHLPFPFGGFFRKTSKNLESLVDFFREQKADVLGLVEIDSGSYRSGHRNQANFIAWKLGHHPFCRSKYVQRSWWGRLPLMRKQANACLSGHRVLNQRSHFLRKGVKRLVIELELDEVVVFIVHLALGRRCRAAQLADLAKLAQKATKPYLIAGDFNAFAGKVELADFMKSLNLSSANRENAPTFPSRSPRWQLDFILHSPDIRITHFEVAQAMRLSDHLPLICDFEVTRPAVSATA